MFFLALVVGLMEVSPNMCQVDLLNPDNTIDTFEVKCEYMVNEEVVIPYRAPYGP